MISSESVNESIVEGPGCLYVFFGGIAGKLGMPPFEFYRASQVLEHSRIFVRDLHQAWYHRGLAGISDDLQGTADFLSSRIDTLSPSRVVFVGNSMGGFAALLFCAMIGTGRAVAFSPQTFVSQSRRGEVGDGRWPNQIQSLHSQIAHAPTFELGPWLRAHAVDVEADIYVSTKDRLDLLHASELEGLRGLRINRFDEGGHELVTYLRDQSLLGSILDPTTRHPTPNAP